MKKLYEIDNEILEVEMISQSEDQVLFKFRDKEYAFSLKSLNDAKIVLSHNGVNSSAVYTGQYFCIEGYDFNVKVPHFSRSKSKILDVGQMISPMPGKILKVLVKVNDKVTAGTPILVMEAMKMEHTIKASKDGMIQALLFNEGDQVSGGVELVVIC